MKKKGSVPTLRHTFATHQVHNGLKINQLKEVLGHKKMESTYKYVHLDRTNLRQEMKQGALSNPSKVFTRNVRLQSLISSSIISESLELIS